MIRTEQGVHSAAERRTLGCPRDLHARHGRKGLPVVHGEEMPGPLWDLGPRAP